MTDWREEIWPGCTQDATLPKLPEKQQAFQWIGKDGGFKVGTIAIDVDGEVITRDAVLVSVLVKHSHTGELEWLGYDDLQPYPPSPIEEPTK